MTRLATPTGLLRSAIGRLAGPALARRGRLRAQLILELGYALGRSRRVVITAKQGTQLAFDQDKLARYFWEGSTSPDGQRIEYRDSFDR
jgi:hypothetical protein